MKLLSKTSSAKAIKAIRTLLMEVGAIEMTTNSNSTVPIYTANDSGSLGFKIAEENSFLMDTKAGLLWLRIDCDVGSTCYTVFGNFEDRERAEVIFGYDMKHNSKFNFHQSELGDLLKLLAYDLKRIVKDNRAIITTFDGLNALLNETNVEHKNIFTFNFNRDCVNVLMIMDGIVYKNNRVSVGKATKDNNFEFKNWRGKMIVVVDGCAHLINKSSKFQLLIDW